VSVATGGPPRDFNFTLWTNALPLATSQGDGQSGDPEETTGSLTGATTPQHATFSAPLTR
jgi:hypothetical protein